MTENEKLLARINKRKADLEVYYNRLVKQIESNQFSNTEADRLWLEKFAIGEGLDCMCGDFVLGDAIGIDTDKAKIGASYFLIDATKLTQIPELSQNFIISNYLDACSNVLEVLFNWKRVLKPTGVLALVVRNADTYIRDAGPLENNKRLSLFTPRTLKFYLRRAGLEPFETETVNNSLRMAAKKI